jgi:hypothetical protein
MQHARLDAADHGGAGFASSFRLLLLLLLLMLLMALTCE